MSTNNYGPPYSPGNNTVQAVGGFIATFSHLLINGGNPIILKGFKLEDTFVHTAQIMPNSKIIPLVDGGTVALTNAMLAGRLTINALRVSTNYNDGDLVLIANILQGAADNVGGLMKFTYGLGLNGVQSPEAVTFFRCIVESSPPSIYAGNDLPVYPVVFNYAYFVRTAQ